MHRHHLIVASVLFIAGAGAQAQRPQRPLSLPAIFSAMRYQNTQCEGENEEAGLCLYEVNVSHWGPNVSSLTTHLSLQNECLNRKGSVIGRCANGFAACCSFKFTCGADTSQNETLFVNRQYPQAENDTNTCQVTIKKMDNICQLRLGKSIGLLAHRATPNLLQYCTCGCGSESSSWLAIPLQAHHDN